MKITNNVVRWLSDQPHHRVGMRIAQAGVGALILFRLATECRRAEFLWGPNGIGRGSMTWQFGDGIGGVLDHVFATTAGVYALLAVLGGCGLALVLGRATRIASAAGLLAFVMLEQRSALLGDGGDNISRIVLVFMPLLLSPRETAEPGSLRVWMHNLAVIAIIAQVLVLYETSGFMKASGERWHHGTALYYISQVDLFWHPALKFLTHSPLVALACYATVLHQLLFPVAFISRLRIAWVALGISFHVGIAVVMGLVPFSMVMIGLELSLLSDADMGSLRRAGVGAVAVLSRVRARCRVRVSEHALSLRTRRL